MGACGRTAAALWDAASSNCLKQHVVFLYNPHVAFLSAFRYSWCILLYVLFYSDFMQMNTCIFYRYEIENKLISWVQDTKAKFKKNNVYFLSF